MIDWEEVFEGQLIPLVSSATSPSAIDACVAVVIDALFRRSGDTDNKEYFRNIFNEFTGRANDFQERVGYAAEFLRLVKSVRKDLADKARLLAESGHSRINEATGEIVSSDLVVLANSCAPAAIITPPTPAKVAAPAKAAPAKAAAPAPAAPAAAEAKPAAPTIIGFDVVFDDALCGQFCGILAKLASERGGGGLPFMVAPPFAKALEHVMRTYVLKPIRSSRNIVSNLRDSHVWDREAESKVIEVLTAGEINNPILLGWDKRWGELGGKSTAGVGDGKLVWAYFRKHAKEHHYLPPQPADLQVLLTLPRFSLKTLDKAWGELAHCYEQEFEPKSHQARAREGAFRDALNKWGDREGMPPHTIEWIAIKASLDLPKLSKAWLEDFSKNKGKTAAERARNIPFLTAYLAGA